jgi:hypothetical protein
VVRKVKDKKVWESLEEALLTNFHLYSIEQQCLLEFAIKELKPKYISTRFSDILHKNISDCLDNSPTLSQIHHISQGFRRKENKAFYMKIRENLLVRKHQFFDKI